jgi:hypothetical protein
MFLHFRSLFEESNLHAGIQTKILCISINNFLYYIQIFSKTAGSGLLRISTANQNGQVEHYLNLESNTKRLFILESKGSFISGDFIVELYFGISA